MTETKTEIAAVTPLPRKVISGGQTGADQAGLVAARRFGIPTGGWMPRGWKTSAGPNPHLGREYGLREPTGDYAERTATNVRDSDGTIRFAGSFQTFGELCTLKWITHYGRPHIDIDIRSRRFMIDIVKWVQKNKIRVLNVAGNREPKSRTALASGITAFVTDYLAQLFRQLGHQDTTEGNE
jgi:predicted Rossmann-fold nucleotide-binding protein